MVRHLYLFAVLAVFPLFIQKVYSDQVLTAEKVQNSPIIDGKADDPVWKQGKEIVTHDKTANIDITIKALYSDTKIFFLVVFPDPDESRTHKSWAWDKKIEIYKQGLDREDVFIFKWNLMPYSVDLSIYSDSPYLSDIWFWKACRSDPSGHADDKKQQLSETELPDSKKLTSKSGKIMYLQRIGDKGTAAYKTTLFTEYQEGSMPHFESQTPSGSRADVRAKGSWAGGKWVIEFERSLKTGDNDDIQLEPDKTYQLGVSRYEIAGRLPETESSQPLFGCGDISENLKLNFNSKQQKSQ